MELLRIKEHSIISEFMFLLDFIIIARTIHHK